MTEFCRILMNLRYILATISLDFRGFGLKISVKKYPYNCAPTLEVNRKLAPGGN